MTTEALDQRDKAVAEREVLQAKLQTERVMRLTYERRFREIKEGSDQALMMLEVSDTRSAIEILKRFE